MLIGTLLLGLLADFRYSADLVWCGRPSAILWEDQLFASVSGRIDGPVGGLFRGGFVPERRGVPSPLSHSTQMVAHRTNLSKLELRDGRLLFFSTGHRFFYIVPLAELPGLEDSDFGTLIARARGYRNSSALLDYYGGELTSLLFPDHRKPDVFPPPFEDLVSLNPSELELGYRVGRYVNRARSDLQIAGEKTVRMFHAHDGKLFVSIEKDYLRAWHYDKSNKEIKNPPSAPDRQLRTGQLPAGFTGYFAVYTVGGRDYMVTSDGKVYMATLKGKSEMDVKVLWDDPKQKVAGVVQDQDNNAVYGWGYAGKDGSSDRFYLKFDPKPAPVRYALTVSLWRNITDAYLESYECARAFRKNKNK